MREYYECEGETDVGFKIEEFKTAANETITDIINLIIVFMVQTLLLPLLFAWLGFGIAKGMVRYAMAIPREMSRLRALITALFTKRPYGQLPESDGYVRTVQDSEVDTPLNFWKPVCPPGDPDQQVLRISPATPCSKRSGWCGCWECLERQVHAQTPTFRL